MPMIFSSGSGGGSVNVGNISTTVTIPQEQAAALWIINHNLGYNPAVSCEDNMNNDIEGDVSYVTDNQVTVKFSEPVWGRAHLS